MHFNRLKPYAVLIILLCNAVFFAIEFGTDVVKSETYIDVERIDADTVWTKANSPYIVLRDLRINYGVNLTVEAGVTVKFNGTKLIVDGSLLVKGNATDKVVFTANSTSKWVGVVFTELCDETGSKIEYLEISNASVALNCTEKAPLIANSLITNNTVGITGGKKIVAVVIANNTNGILTEKSANLTIVNSSIKSNLYGIRLNASTNLFIFNSTFECNKFPIQRRSISAQNKLHIFNTTFSRNDACIQIDSAENINLKILQSGFVSNTGVAVNYSGKGSGSRLEIKNTSFFNTTAYGIKITADRGTKNLIANVTINLTEGTGIFYKSVAGGSGNGFLRLENITICNSTKHGIEYSSEDVTNVRLNNSVIERTNGSAIRLNQLSGSANVNFKNLKIKNNRIGLQLNASAALYFSAQDCEITYNEIGLDSNITSTQPVHIDISNTNCSSNNQSGMVYKLTHSSHSIKVNNTQLYNNHEGLKIESATGTYSNVKLNIWNTQIYGCGANGILISTAQSSGGKLACTNVTIWHNNLSGVVCYADNWQIVLEKSEISYNNCSGVNSTAPFKIFNSTVRYNNQIGLFGKLIEAHANNIFKNAVFNFVNRNLRPTITDATNNWWGVANKTAIGDTIYDYYENATYGITEYEPFLNTPVLSTIRVIPQSVILKPVESTKFNATAYNLNNNRIEEVGFEWYVQPSSLGVVENGTFTANTSVGAGKIYAKNGTTVGYANIRIVPGQIAIVKIAPTSAILKVKEQLQFTARAEDAFGNEISGLGFDWSVWPYELGTITQTGLQTALFEAGTVTMNGFVNASYSDLKASAQVTIVQGEVAQVFVEPTTAKIVVGEAKVFKSYATDRFSNLIDGVVFEWFLSDARAGTLNTTTGSCVEFTANTTFVGECTLTVRNSTCSATATIQIVPANVFVIEVKPSSVNLTVGKTKKFTATAYDRYHNLIVTAKFDWAVEGNIGTIRKKDSDAILYAAEKVAAGFVCAYNDSVLGKAEVQLLPAELDSIKISPPFVNLTADEQCDFDATCFDKYYNVLPITPAWHAENGTIDQTGYYKPYRTGRWRITAVANGISGTAYVTVKAGNLTVIKVEPSEAKIELTLTVQFSATGLDKYNNKVETIKFNWSVFGGVGTISENGLFKATHPGIGYVNASYGFINGSAKVEVLKLCTITGKVVDNTNRPISNAEITVKYLNGTILTTRLSDKNGTYKITDLLSGSYELVASKEGYRSATQTVTLAPEANITVVFELAKIIKPGYLFGFAVDTENNPLAFVKISVYIKANMKFVKSVETVQNGSYSISLPPDDYTIVANKSGYLNCYANITLEEDARLLLNFTLQKILPPTKEDWVGKYAVFGIIGIIIGCIAVFIFVKNYYKKLRRKKALEKKVKKVVKKVKYRCSFCKAIVSEKDEICPKCGKKFEGVVVKKG